MGFASGRFNHLLHPTRPLGGGVGMIGEESSLIFPEPGPELNRASRSMEAVRMEPGQPIEVPRPLDPGQVQSFVDEGYLVVPGMMEEAEAY